MRRLFLVFVFTILAIISKSQNGSPIPMLISVSTKGCIKHLDSLLSLKGNYKIDSLTDNAGNLIISVDFPFEYADFYRCATTSLLLFGESKKELCLKQIISGPIKYGYDNLQLVKQRFTPKQDELGVWELDYPDSSDMKIRAEYKVKEDGFTLIYSLIKK